ncbi:hypothetical protein AMQ83_14480 [Paenibacillus riograndensis]|nr:hypothetical protein AMQ83_14480 [Paenibacillus riograndensis]
MNHRKMGLSLVIAMQMLLPLVLTGCWDSVELNRRAIVSGVAIDRGPSEAQKSVLSFQGIVGYEISGEQTRSKSPVALY